MKSNSDKLISRLFFSMLPVQILIFAMGSINSIVDGTMAGRYIGANAVGIIGLYYSMVNVMNAISSVLLGGTTVLCGRYMGRGEIQKTEGVFSLNLTVTFIVGLFLTTLSLIVPGPIADILGANQELKEGLVLYIVGYAIGIVPMMLAQQIAAFLQMERQSKRGYIGIAGMIISNVTLDITLVGMLKMGIRGLALATSISNIVYFLILVPYYFSDRAQLRYGVKKILWCELVGGVKIGFPGAMLVFCLGLRGMVINRVLLKYAGNDGLSALSAFNMVSGFLIAYCLGNGSVIRMLISVFVGEEDIDSMKNTLKLVFTKALAVSCAFAVVMLLISRFVVFIFFPDRTSNVYQLCHQLFIIYSLCVPLVLICQIFTNYLQATGHNLFVNIQSIFDGFFFMVIPALILAPVMGAMGVWLSNPIGIVMTMLTVPVYDLIFWKRIPRNMEEWMFLTPDFGVAKEDRMEISVRSLEEVSAASADIQSFCMGHGMEKKPSYYAALCLEEMAGNVVTHGFNADGKKHSLSTIVMFKNGDIVLRIKDDCVPFNPKEMAELVKNEKDGKNIGIRIVMKIADEVNYQNMMGLNVLTLAIKEDDHRILDLTP
ncbi:MAG: ATP-binding protein [Butyrivibrio sp.]|nr:ATP-binding protein [Butyrivibrio sp.]